MKLIETLCAEICKIKAEALQRQQTNFRYDCIIDFDAIPNHAGMFIKICSLVFSFGSTIACFSQQQAGCDIKKYISPDQTMYYFVETDTFYYTQDKQLKGLVETDKENYFLSLQPVPAPASAGKLKLYKPLRVTLSNDSTYTLEFFDARFARDSIYTVMYLFDVKKHQAFLKHNIERVEMITPNLHETFIFRLHKEAVIEQLHCLNVVKKIM